MLKKISPLFFLVLCLSAGSKAQDSLNLAQCIQYALAHNTQLLRAQNDLQQQTNSYNQSRANLLPTLNGSASDNYNFGRTIDPATNQFINQSSQTNYFSLNADWVIFAGLQKLNQVRQYQWSKDAGEQNLQKTKDDISLSIANYYLQILLLTERKHQLENLLKNSEQAQKKTNILYDNGAIPLTKKYEAEAQLATDQYNVVDINNQLLKQYLALKQYMNYDITKPLKIQEINFQGQLEVYTDADVTKVINERVSQLPAVKQARSVRESAMYAWKAMQGTVYPRLSIDASLHTIYSSQYKNYGYSYSGLQPIGIVGADTTKIVYGPKYSAVGNGIKYGDQLSQNFGQTVGFTLSIPIFNGLQTRYNVRGANITFQSDELLLTDAEVKSKNDIYQAYENMKAAKEKFDAGNIKLKSQEALFKQSDISYQAGAMSFFDFNTARSNFSNAQSDYDQAKYEYIFQTKVFEYYLGKPVSF
jgi:outer membrane protein